MFRSARENLFQTLLLGSDDIQQEILAPGRNPLDDVLDTLQARVGLMRQWQIFLQEHPVLLTPISAELPFPDLLDVESEQAFDRVMEAQLLQIALPFLGLPGLCVSTDLVGDVPVGVQLVAGRYHEARLLRAAEAIERAGTPPSPIDPAS